MLPVCCLRGGQAMAMPDVCKTPAPPPAAPLPVPYPNTAIMNMATKFAPKVLITGSPALNQGSKVPMTNGDEAGSIGGVTSGKIKGPMKFTMGSTKVKFAKKPAVRCSDPTGHNGSNPNAPCGRVAVPSQTKVLAR